MPDLSAVPDSSSDSQSDGGSAHEAQPKRKRTKRNAAHPSEATAIPAEAAAVEPARTESRPVPWSEYVRAASADDIEQRFSSESNAIIAKFPELAERYAIVALFEPEETIAQFELDQVFAALARLNPNQEKDVLLLLLSPGGGIEPAYQISKLCKSAARTNFAVCIPRQAKSAATLIALGADEIHMGLLGQLGPIDPQVQGLPALGVSQALETLASLVERHPASAPLFASYLQRAVKIEQIGYYERICASAVQYAERLLSTKKHLPKPAVDIARELVHEYKDHGFVIDTEEAMGHLGSDWIKLATPETELAERLYRLFEHVNLFLGYHIEKKLWVAGSFDDGIFIFDRSSRRGA